MILSFKWENKTEEDYVLPDDVNDLANGIKETQEVVNGVNSKIGDIDIALDEIMSIQENFIGGETT